MSWQEQSSADAGYEPEMTFEEKKRIIGRAREAIAKVKQAKAEVNQARIEELREMERRWQK
jgi:hypothetical protein